MDLNQELETKEKLKQIFLILKNNLSDPIKIRIGNLEEFITISYNKKEIINIILTLENKIIFSSYYGLSNQELIIRDSIIKILINNKLENIEYLNDNRKTNIQKSRNIFLQHSDYLIKQTYITRCNLTEFFFHELFNPKSKYYKRGILIYHNSELIGIYKLKGERLLLSLKTNSNNCPLEKSGLYELELRLSQELEKFSYTKNKKNILQKIISFKKIYENKKINEFYRVNIVLKYLPISINKSITEHFLNSRTIGSIKETTIIPKKIRKSFLEFKEIIKTQNIAKYFLENINKTYNENKEVTKFDKIINLK